MEQLDLDINYKPSDFVSAAKAYRRSLGENRIWAVIILSCFVVIVFIPTLFPLWIGVSTCIGLDFLIRYCSSAFLWQSAWLTILVVSGGALLFFVTYSGIADRLTIEILYRLIFVWNKQRYQSAIKVIIFDEGVEIQRPSSKTMIYWKSFQQILESQDAFLLPTQKNRYLIIPKCAIKSSDDSLKFIQVIVAETERQIKKI